jgi:hypothetical protein
MKNSITCFLQFGNDDRAIWARRVERKSISDGSIAFRWASQKETGQ